MQNLLQEIHGVVGVTGAFVAGPDGALLASTMPATFDPKAFPPVARTFMRTFEGLRMARRRKVTEMDLVFDGGRLVVKNLGQGCLVIHCAPTINLPLLNLTANVVARKISQQLKPPAKEAAAGAPPAPPVAAGPVAPTQAVPTAGVGPVVVERLKGIVRARMGDDGVEFFEREMAAAGLSETSTAEMFDRLARELDTPLSLAIGGRAARQMVEALRKALLGGGD